nr:MAG: hypothetical protein [Porcellio scaber clopovirus]
MESKDSFYSYYATAQERLVTFITLDDLKIFEFIKFSQIVTHYDELSMRMVVHKRADKLTIFFEFFSRYPTLHRKIVDEDFSECLYHIKITRSSTKDTKNKCLLYEGLKNYPLFVSGAARPYVLEDEKNIYLFHAFLVDFQEVKDLLNHNSKLNETIRSCSSSSSSSSSSCSSRKNSKIRRNSSSIDDTSSHHHLKNEKDHDGFIKIKIGLRSFNSFGRIIEIWREPVLRISKPIAIHDYKFDVENFLYNHSVFKTESIRDCDKVVNIFLKNMLSEPHFTFTCDKNSDKNLLDLKEHDVDSLEIIDRARWHILINSVKEFDKLFHTNDDDDEVERRNISIEGYFEKTENFKKLSSNNNSNNNSNINSVARDENRLRFVCFKKSSPSDDIDIFLEGVISPKLNNDSSSISEKDDDDDDVQQDTLIIDKRIFEYDDEDDIFHKFPHFRKGSLRIATATTTNGSFDDNGRLIKLYNVSVELVIEIFRFLITGHIPEKFLRKPINIGKLLILANYFQNVRLMNYLNIYVRTNLNRNNAAYFFCIAEKFGICDLREMTLDFLFRHQTNDSSDILYNLFPEYHYLVLTYRPRYFDDEKRIKTKWRYKYGCNFYRCCEKRYNSISKSKVGNQ